MLLRSWGIISDLIAFSQDLGGEFTGKRNSRNEQGISRKYELMLEMYSRGRSYPRTKIVYHGTIS